jgi:L-fucose mutarotase
MILHSVTHPGLLSALAGAGHGSAILIADGNYPLSTASGPAASLIHLNLRPGMLDATIVLKAVLDVVPIEAARVMSPNGDEPPIFDDFRALLPGIELSGLTRGEFYDAARSSDLAVAIATGEQRLFGNILLTIGVVNPEESSK